VETDEAGINDVIQNGGDQECVHGTAQAKDSPVDGQVCGRMGGKVSKDRVWKWYEGEDVCQGFLVCGIAKHLTIRLP